MRFYVGFLALFFATWVFATPREIIIVRHAEGWPQTEAGPFLSPKGQVRAMRFVSYYLKHFQKPDYIFTTNPVNPVHDASGGVSLREIQTMAPLANQLAYRNSNGYSIQRPYFDKEYDKLADLLLHDKTYDNKIILICWHHGHINDLSQALGVPLYDLKTWESDVYDRVYVLKYNEWNALTSFKILEHQYPVKKDYTWRELA